jgi:hypothetical protein
LTPNASIAKGAAASEATTSTTNNAGWPAASIARRSAARSLVVPLAVSVWTAKTAPMRCDVGRAQRDAAERFDLFGPPVREMTGARHQDRGPWRHQIGDDGLPAAVAVGGVEQDLGTIGLQQGLHAGLAGGDQVRHARIGEIGGLARHRVDDLVGHVGRAG